MDEVPLLSAEQARWLTIHRSVAKAGRDVDAVQDAVDAIRDGRTKTVAVRSEAEWREFIYQNRGGWTSMYLTNEILAILQAINLVSDDKGGG